MIEVLQIIATSWPIAVMVIGLAAAITVRRSLKQSMDNSNEIQNIRASQSVVVRDRHSDDAG